MNTADDFSTYVSELLTGRYDCVDRICLRGYFPLGLTSGGLLKWWEQLHPGVAVTEKKLRGMAGDFARRVKAYAQKHQIALEEREPGDRSKRAWAERKRPEDPQFRGVFAIVVTRASAPVWQVWTNRGGKVVVRRKWQLVKHYHFHLIDPEWGHVTVRMSGHPPFGVLVSLNGHEWVQRQAQRRGVAWVKERNCFVGGSDVPALDAVAADLAGPHGLVQLAQVCDRWIYSACLCFGLTVAEQEQSGFRFAYSLYQMEYSRNLLFKNGRRLDELYQGLIERTRQHLDVPRLKTIFGRKQRPSWTKREGSGRLEKIIDRSVYDLTVFKVHFGKLTLKMYDKGDRVLRVEVIVSDAAELRCGKKLDRLPQALERLQAMVVEFLSVVQAAHVSFVGAEVLDTLATPTVRGRQRVAGVDLQKPRLRAVASAVVALAAAPRGFTARELAARVRQQQGRRMASYQPRHAAYDLRKLRGKALVERLGKTRRYRVRRPGVRILCALWVLREKVSKPVLAGVGRPKRGRPPKNVHPLDQHYQNLQREMLSTFQTLNIAA